MVIYLSSFRIFLKTFVISGWCLVFFVGFGYYYIDSKTAKVENQIESVPYYSQIPENKLVNFKFGTYNVYTYLDFKNSMVSVTLNPNEHNNYSADYTLECNEKTLLEICNYFDGINLMIEAETLRYAGSQVVELINNDKSDELRKNIISAIFEKIEKQGIGIDFFNMLIVDSKTNLKMPDCYFWAEFMDDISANVEFS